MEVPPPSLTRAASVRSDVADGEAAGAAMSGWGGEGGEGVGVGWGNGAFFFNVLRDTALQGALPQSKRTAVFYHI